MILSPEPNIRRLVDSGGWRRETLDDLLRRAVARDPDALAFYDAGEPAVPGARTRLTWREADARIDALAAFFPAVGMKPDMVLGVHLPPCAEGAVVVLAALRAGLIVCPLALHLTTSEMAEAIAAANVRAIVTAGTADGAATGEFVRDVAAEAFAIRWVFAIGSDVPDGLIDLAAVLAEPEALGSAPEIARRGHPADHVALLSFARSADDRLLVAPFSHNHLVAAGGAHAAAAGMTAGDSLLSTMQPASLAGVAGAIAAALSSGAGVAFHNATGVAGIADAAGEAGAAHLLMPAVLGRSVDGLLAPETTMSLVTPGLDPDAAPQLAPGRRAYDLVTLGGICLLPVPRKADGSAAGLPLGGWRPESADETAPALYETWVKTRIRAGERRPSPGPGELLVSGALVPDAPWPEPLSGATGAWLAFGADGSLKPGLVAQPSADGREIRVSPPLPDTILVAGRRVSADRLDALARAHPSVADAAAFAIDTEIVGSRIGYAVVARPGESVGEAEFSAFLAANGAGPLEIPAVVRPVREIPRAADGSVLRQAIFLSEVA